MRLLSTLVSGVAISLCCGVSAMAQITVDSTNKWAWSENAGWLNWGDTASPNQVKLSATFMQGFVWWENAGWMNMGDGSPTDGVNYANLDGVDFGVNYDPGTDELFGFAWHENLGWVNFGTTPFVGALEGARYDPVSGRLRGYAWSENVGWINLDDATSFVSFTCGGDLNGDGVVSGADLGLLLGNWGNPGLTDLNGDETTNGADLGLLLGNWGPCL